MSKSRRRDDEDRTLPHNLEAERAVLGAVLLNNAAFDVAAKIVKASDFFRLVHRHIWEAITRLLDVANGAADLVTIKEELGRRAQLEEVGVPYLSGLIDGLPRGTNVGHYAEIVREKALHRGIIALANDVMADSYAAELTAAEVIQKVDHGVVALEAGRHHRRAVRLKNDVGTMLDDLQWRIDHQGQVTGIPTGFQSVDEMTNGWQPGDYIVVAARPSIGKTVFTTNSGLHIAQQPGREVFMFSMEMRRKQLEDRALSSLSGVPLSRIQGGYILPHEWEKISQAVGRIGECGFTVDDTANQTVESIRRTLREHKAERGLDMVIIDYLQLITGSVNRKGATRTEEISHISRTLKVMAGELEVPVHVLSQLSRAAEGRPDPRPKLSDLRESGAIEQDADIVMFLHRRDHRASGPTEAIFEKQRNGNGGTVMLSIDRDTQTFTCGADPLPELTPTEKKADDHYAKTRAIIRNRSRQGRNG